MNWIIGMTQLHIYWQQSHIYLANQKICVVTALYQVYSPTSISTSSHQINTEGNPISGLHQIRFLLLRIGFCCWQSVSCPNVVMVTWHKMSCFCTRNRVSGEEACSQQAADWVSPVINNNSHVLLHIVYTFCGLENVSWIVVSWIQHLVSHC